MPLPGPPPSSVPRPSPSSTRPRYVKGSFLTLLFGKPIPNTIPGELMEPLRELEEWAVSNKAHFRLIS
jgi:hypothetical protein